MTYEYPNIDPIAFSIFGIAIRWYALAYIAGIVAGWALLQQIHKNHSLWGKRTTIPHHQLDDVITYATLGIIIGGRLGYVLFYNLEFYIENPEQIYQLWNGGMAFHGGMIGLAIALFIYARWKQFPFFVLMDSIACVAPIGLFFGRIANFINGELWGRVTMSSWGMVFPHAGDLPRHPSQLYQAGLEGITLFIIMMLGIRYFKILQRPAFASGLFLTGYGIARIIGEQFREPDPQLGFLYQNLTMGMILSIPMVILGVFLMYYKRK